MANLLSYRFISNYLSISVGRGKRNKATLVEVNEVEEFEEKKCMRYCCYYCCSRSTETVSEDIDAELTRYIEVMYGFFLWY